jgi:predicted nucleic-acid-binding Zn-ribbon protein
MKQSGLCPKCTSDELFIVETVTQPNQDSINGTHATTVFAVYTETGERGLLGNKSRRYEAGTFEAWVCSQCGFTEWYAKHANEVLGEMARRGEGVRYAKARGGYR